MLQVDLTSTDSELRKHIVKCCSDFGNVISIKIHRFPKPFALVEMANYTDALKLSAQFGRPSLRDCVLVHLEHDGVADTIANSRTDEAGQPIFISSSA